MESAPGPEDIQQLLERLRPPQFPDEVFDPRDSALGQVADWKRSNVSAGLAGLLTEPRFHANTIRLEWLQRLVLSKSTGRRKPQPRDLGATLNEGLGRAGVLRLEDPIEDLFCDRIATNRGDFRIFLGVLQARVSRRSRLLLNLSFTILMYDDAPQRFCWHESMSNNRQEIRPWSPEEEAQLLALHDEGMTATELGERLGRSRQAVYGRLQRFRKQRGRVSRINGRAFAQWIG